MEPLNTTLPDLGSSIIRLLTIFPKDEYDTLRKLCVAANTDPELKTLIESVGSNTATEDKNQLFLAKVAMFEDKEKGFHLRRLFGAPEVLRMIFSLCLSDTRTTKTPVALNKKETVGHVNGFDRYITVVPPFVVAFRPNKDLYLIALQTFYDKMTVVLSRHTCSSIENLSSTALGMIRNVRIDLSNFFPERKAMSRHIASFEAFLWDYMANDNNKLNHMTKVTSLTFVMTHEDCHLARNFITKFLETNERLKQLIIWNLITDVSHSALRKLPHVDMYRLFHFVTQLLVASGVRGEMVGSSWTAEYQSRQVSRKADAWAWQAYQGNNLKIEGDILQDGGACSESVGRSGFGKFEGKFDLGGELSDGLTWWKRYREFSTICKSKHRDIFELRGFDGVTEYNESFHRLIEADSGFGR